MVNCMQTRQCCHLMQMILRRNGLSQKVVFALANVYTPKLFKLLQL